MSKITEYACGKECQIRLIGVCNHNDETTIFAHYRRGGLGGMGQKPSDLHGAFACSSCHDAVDGRTKTHLSQAELDSDFKDGVFRTQEILRAKGFITLKGA